MDSVLTVLAQMREYEPNGAFAGFMVIWFLLMIGGIIGWIIFLVAVWRGMKAHESIARSVERATTAHESVAGSVYTIAQSPPRPAQPPSGRGNL